MIFISNRLFHNMVNDIDEYIMNLPKLDSESLHSLCSTEECIKFVQQNFPRKICILRIIYEHFINKDVLWENDNHNRFITTFRPSTFYTKLKFKEWLNNMNYGRMQNY